TARHLGCPPATIATRIARAKAQLRARLTQMGLAPAAVAIAADLNAAALTAAVPTLLARSTSAAANMFAAGTGGAGAASILSLTEGVGRAMIIQSRKTVFVAGAVLGLAGTGAGVWSVGSAAGEPPVKPDRTALVAQPPLSERPDSMEPEKPGTH